MPNYTIHMHFALPEHHPSRAIKQNAAAAATSPAWKPPPHAFGAYIPPSHIYVCALRCARAIISVVTRHNIEAARVQTPRRKGAPLQQPRLLLLHSKQAISPPWPYVCPGIDTFAPACLFARRSMYRCEIEFLRGTPRELHLRARARIREILQADWSRGEIVCGTRREMFEWIQSSRRCRRRKTASSRLLGDAKEVQWLLLDAEMDFSGMV